VEETSVARFLDGAMADASRAADLVEWRRLLIARTVAFVGSDTTAVLPAPPLFGGIDDPAGATAHGLDAAALDHFLLNRTRYWRRLDRLGRAMAACGGIVIDREVFNARERQTLPIYVEAILPAGIKEVLAAVISFRGRPTAVLCLNRHGPQPYRDRQVARLRALLPFIAMADAAFAAGIGRLPLVPQVPLSAREAEVCTLIRAGLQNKEIATILATSVDTVRKHTIHLYKKLGVSGRSEVIARLGGTPESRRARAASPG
jgi:DNA-binding CsgD family transcriptional regulator